MDGEGPLGRAITTLEWDLADNRTALVDPAENRTEFVFDGLNRLVEETNELEATRSFQYDAANNVTQITDRNGRVRQFDYDHLHRLIEENWIEESSSIYTASYQWDAANQLIGASDVYSTYAYTRDALGRVALEEIDNGGQQVELASDFDLAGNRLRLAASFDVGEGFVDDLENVATFDKLHRLVRLEQSGVDGGNAVAEKRVDLAYNAASQFTTITRFNDLDGDEADIVAMSAFGYDLMGRLTDLTHGTDVDEGVPTTTIADYHWTYDADSRITEMSFTALVGLDGTSAYSYDNTDQLVGADHDFQADEEHDLDENGNRTEGGYTTGANNRLTSDGIWNYGTDDEGNRIWQERISEDPADDHRIEFGFDHRNRLTSIVYKDEQDNVTRSIAYVYDVFDRRIEKAIDWDGEGEDGPVLVQYIYDGVHILLAFNGDNELTNRYLHGLITDQAFTDEHVTDLETVGEVLWILPDNQGSARDIVDSDGDVLNHMTYSAAGEVTTETATAVDTIFGAFGRERDEESLLDYNRARYLDTATGRFTSEDPKGFAAGDTNLSRYVFNSPTNLTDPSGLDPGGEISIDYGGANNVDFVMGAGGDWGDRTSVPNQSQLFAMQQHAKNQEGGTEEGGTYGPQFKLTEEAEQWVRERNFWSDRFGEPPWQGPLRGGRHWELENPFEIIVRRRGSEPRRDRRYRDPRDRTIQEILVDAQTPKATLHVDLGDIPGETHRLSTDIDTTGDRSDGFDVNVLVAVGGKVFADRWKNDPEFRDSIGDALGLSPRDRQRLDRLTGVGEKETEGPTAPSPGIQWPIKLQPGGSISTPGVKGTVEPRR